MFPAIKSITEDSNVVACSSATDKEYGDPDNASGAIKTPSEMMSAAGPNAFLGCGSLTALCFLCFGCFWEPARSLNKIGANGWSALGVHHIPFDTSMNQPKVCWLRGLAVANTLRLVENLSEGDTKQFT